MFELAMPSSPGRRLNDFGPDSKAPVDSPDVDDVLDCGFVHLLTRRHGGRHGGQPSGLDDLVQDSAEQ